MLKLPLCPYCGARFLYHDVRKIHGTGKCPHCGKTFRAVRGRGLAVLIPAAVLAMIGVNILLMNIPSMNLTYLSAVTAAGVLITYLLFPFTVRYKPR